MRKVIVVGGGAAGMMAAVAAAREGARVCLYEKNEKTGKKLYITGKGRCNLTNACGAEEFFAHVCRNPKFLYSSFYRFTNQEAMRFFQEAGCPVKVERGERVFPVTDHSSDVLRALERSMAALGVEVHLRQEVRRLTLEDGRVRGVELSDGRRDDADAVIVCTGGLSYPSTGSTGDGLRFAREAGLAVTDCSPSLVPMDVEQEDVRALQGLSLKNVSLSLYAGEKPVWEGFGEMMFTHFGITGPLVLTASAMAGDRLSAGPLKARIDLKSALSREKLDQRILRDFAEGQNKQLDNVLGALLPAKLIPVLIARTGIPPQKKIHDISRRERGRLLDQMKGFALTVTALRGYQEAVITRGGVAVRQIRPDTLEAKKIPNLYFAGEVLDLDALTGGFNLQIAWSTGFAAGCGAAKGGEE